ncbi:protein-export chaperone SecB [Mammaliicoccus sciuri]|uniref:protein-export chaperone SecB n=1 Tax=Mammaliicoccus sciuri TaxID=1296 RepID=UPI003364FB03
MAGLSFINYVVDEMYYKTNSSFELPEGESIKINEEFRAEIVISSKSDAVVAIQCTLEEDKKIPFSFDVKIVGYFEYNSEEADDIEFQDFLKANAVAILYPYLREVISNLTGKSNSYPNYNLPIKNISKEMQENDSIKVIYLDE